MNDVKQQFLRLQRSDGAWVAPPELKAKLVEAAEEDGSNMTEIVNRILCKHYKLKFIPSGRRSSASPDGPVINISLPLDVRQAVKLSAVTHGRSDALEIFTVLAKHFGLTMPTPPPVARKPRRKKKRRSVAA